jgi:hypothetical protein
MTTSTPSYSQAESYLETRAYNEGITVDELLDMTPTSVSDDAVESMLFWQQRHYSHGDPVSLFPERANDPDNAMPEDPQANMQRGANVMTPYEKEIARLDNEILAAEIDLQYTGDSGPIFVDPNDIPDLFPDFIPVFGLL